MNDLLWHRIYYFRLDMIHKRRHDVVVVLVLLLLNRDIQAVKTETSDQMPVTHRLKIILVVVNRNDSSMLLIRNVVRLQNLVLLLWCDLIKV